MDGRWLCFTIYGFFHMVVYKIVLRVNYNLSYNIPGCSELKINSKYIFFADGIFSRELQKILVFHCFLTIKFCDENYFLLFSFFVLVIIFQNTDLGWPHQNIRFLANKYLHLEKLFESQWQILRQ